MCEQGLPSHAYLLGLAFPSPLAVVWPPPCKGGLARRDHVWVIGVLGHVALHLGRNGSDDGPAAVCRMLEMLLNRAVALLPPVHALVAEKTNNIVGVVGERLEEETGIGEL